MTQQSLVSISEASQVLGVSEVTLRQWTDEGKIKVFITPGGHRRYTRADLKRFMTSRQKVLGIKDIVAELENVAPLHREIARAYLNTTSGHIELSQESRERLAELGRSILSLIVRYIAEPSKREETIKQARDVGGNFGETLARIGLPLTDAVEIFILHRNPIMNAAIHLMEKREVLNGRVVEAIPLVTHVMDEALVSLVAAYQQYREVLRSEPKVGAVG